MSIIRIILYNCLVRSLSTWVLVRSVLVPNMSTFINTITVLLIGIVAMVATDDSDSSTTSGLNTVFMFNLLEYIWFFSFSVIQNRTVKAHWQMINWIRSWKNWRNWSRKVCQIYWKRRLKSRSVPIHWSVLVRSLQIGYQWCFRHALNDPLVSRIFHRRALPIWIRTVRIISYAMCCWPKNNSTTGTI